MSKQGFALIELLIALFIASGIAVLLSGALFQVYNSVGLVQDKTENLNDAYLINQVIKKDIAGICIPISVLEQEKEEEKEKERAKQPPTANQGIAQAPPAVEQKKEKKKPLEKILYSVNKDKHLSLLTFITNNPQQAYWDKKIGKAVPFIVRVVYRLELDKRFSARNKPVYRLMRQQGYVLDFDEYKDKNKGPARAFALVNNIKTCTIEYNYFEQTDKEEKNKKPVLKKKSEWNDKIEEESKDKESKHQLPALVHLKFELWDADMIGSQEYQFAFEIPLIEYKEPKKEQPKNNPEQKQTPEKQAPVAPQQPTIVISHDVKKTTFPSRLTQAIKRSA